MKNKKILSIIIAAIVLVVLLASAAIFGKSDDGSFLGKLSDILGGISETEGPGEGPVTTDAPDETEAPEAKETAASKPTATPKPKTTAEPSATEKATPKPTATPKATAKPTTTPKATAKPTATPKATPKATAKPTATPAIDKNGTYDDKDSVALYIKTYGKLPPNYMKKADAEALGWSGGSLERYAKGKCIGGDYFGNYEGILPKGKKYTECDIDTLGKSSRGAKRIIFSSDGHIYYTDDHYESFVEYQGDGTWK